MFCSYCGNQILDQAVVCPKCGVVPKNSSSAKPDTVARRTIVCSYILAIVIPLFGFFAGVYLLCKKLAGHGVACMVLSILVFLIDIIFLVMFSFDS